MRFCFYNPHLVDILGESMLSSIFAWGKPAKRNRRLEFLLEILRNKEYASVIVVDGTVSSLPFRRLGPLFNNPHFIRAFSFFEIYAWCLLNGLNPFRQTIIFSLDKLDPARDILFGFAYLGKTFFDATLTERSMFKKFMGKKILHATHFYENTEIVADNVRRAGVTTMVAEVDIRKSAYFKKYFGFISSIRILPFALRSRYRDTTAFSLRKNKCVALGTLAFFPDGHEPTASHRAFFNTNTLHPMRKTIFDHTGELTPVIDSRIVTHKKKPQNKKRGIVEILWSNINPAEKEYHSFDIVKTYNEYRIFVSPEETIGQPSVNIIEGMACGCAYIGLDSPMYGDMGFAKGIHYIVYDGTLGDLVRKIEYYQAHPDELERIAAAGRAFVLAHCKPDRVVREFMKAVEVL